MNRDSRVAAALAAIVLAAGIEVATAAESDALDRQAQNIRSLSSVEALETELAQMRALDPNNALIPTIISRIVAATQPTLAQPTVAQAPAVAPANAVTTVAALEDARATPAGSARSTAGGPADAGDTPY